MLSQKGDVCGRACRRPGKRVAVGSHAPWLRNKPGLQVRFVGDAAMSVQPHDRVRSPGSSAVGCLPAVPVLYFHGRWQAAIHVAGRGAADMTVLQNHMSKACGRMGVANAMPGQGSENAILGRRQIVQIHRQTSRLQGNAFFVLFWRRNCPHGHVVAYFWRCLAKEISRADSCIALSRMLALFGAQSPQC